MNISKTSVYAFFTLLALVLCFNVKNTYSQEVREDDPKTFKYFKINATADDDSVFVKIQDEMSVDPKLSTFTIVVNVSDADPNNHYVVIGEETDPTKIQVSWNNISKPVQQKLLNWSAPNKINLAQKKYNYISVFVDAIKRIKIKEVISPPKKEREILNTTAYINPYLNFFGGEPLGIPLKKSFGFSFQLGTPYSGPLETDIIAANFHLLGAKVGVTTRIKELVRKRDAGATSGEKESTFGNYNNIFTPKLGLQASYVLPFGNFLEASFFSVLDSGDYDPPLKVKNNLDTVKNGAYMPNIYIAKGSYFNFEFRYPIRTFGSTRAKIYIAKYFGEFHAGYSAREIRLAGSVFDLRMDYTFSNAQRNWQFLWEAYVSNISESFGLSSFAIGPSIRLTKTPNGQFGVVTAMVNARLKIGDFYEEK
ncbi:MAG: hypothetical protein LWX07_02990 [Bacteroidetes bacterium]|nr:hypothetical protein [Bacteroidota bacterium]